MLYEAINTAVFDSIPVTSNRILDIGCGTGNLGKELKKRGNHEIVGITFSNEEATVAANHLDSVLVEDLNDSTFLNKSMGQFDCIICSHILEHLYSPESLLASLHEILSPKGIIVIALPNALNWRQRLKFLNGNFKYTNGGLMDKTHIRFFDWDTAFELVQNSDYKVLSRHGDGYFPSPFIRKIIEPIAVRLDKIATNQMPGLFSTQFILVAQNSLSIHEQ